MAVVCSERIKHQAGGDVSSGAQNEGERSYFQTGVLSLLVVKYFTVQDGAKAINVITERPLPRKGQRIRVVGKVHEGLSWGEHTLLVLIEDKESPAAPSDRNQGSVGPIEILPGSI